MYTKDAGDVRAHCAVLNALEDVAQPGPREQRVCQYFVVPSQKCPCASGDYGCFPSDPSGASMIRPVLARQ
ncbi:unnamed protein product [Jaminaea pallidilutea]